MGNPIRRIESPSSSALQVIEAHRLFLFVKLHLHGRLLAARIDILPFLTYTARDSCKILVCAISPDKPPKKSNCSSHHLHRRDFNTMLAYNCNLQKSLIWWDCVPVILTKSSWWKSRYCTGLLTWCEIVSKRGLLVLNLQKPTTAKALQMCQLLYLKQSRFGILKRKCMKPTQV